MSYTICSRFKGGHIVYAGYTICTSREHIVYGAFCGSTVPFSIGLTLLFSHQWCMTGNSPSDTCKHTKDTVHFFFLHKTSIFRGYFLDLRCV